MMKYIIRPLYIREAIIYGNLQSFEAVKSNKTFTKDQIDGKETLGDVLAKDNLWCKDFDFPKLPTFKCFVCSNDIYEDYNNFKDFEDVDSFLLNNESDWQDGGLYNAAHIVKMDEDFNIIEESFYSVARRSFIEMRIFKGYYHITSDKKRLMEEKDFNPKKLAYYKDEVKKYVF